MNAKKIQRRNCENMITDKYCPLLTIAYKRPVMCGDSCALYTCDGCALAQMPDILYALEGISDSIMAMTKKENTNEN